MESERKPFLGANWLLNWLQVWFCKNKYPFLSSMVAGMLAHGFAITNKLLNHDELGCLFAKGASVDSGRWGLDVLSLVMPDYSMPWIYGILTVFLISLAVCLIVELMQIKSKVLQILLGGLILTYPSLTGTITYMFTSSSYGVSYFLAVLSVCLVCRKGLWNKVAAVGCLVLSVSIYQAYLAVAATLLVLYLIRRLLIREATAQVVLLQGIGFVVFLAISVGVYWLVQISVSRIFAVEMNYYARDALTGGGNFLMRFVYAYGIFVLSFLKGSQGLVPTLFGRILHILCLVLTIIEVIVWLRNNPRKWENLLLLLLAALLPLAMNSIYLITSTEAIHTLVLYSNACIYVVTAVVLEACGQPPRTKKLCVTRADVVALCMALVVLCNTYLANEIHLKVYMTYENAYSLCNTILARVQMTPNYTRDTEVVLMGAWIMPGFYEEFEGIENIAGSGGVTINSWAKASMFNVYCGQTMKINDSDEVKQQIAATEEFRQMPAYPDAGSVCMIDDRVIVKLS